MAVEHAHEDRHAHQRPRAELQLGGWNRQREAEAAREKLALVDDEPAAPNRNPPAVENGDAEPPSELPIDRADAAE